VGFFDDSVVGLNDPGSSAKLGLGFSPPLGLDQIGFWVDGCTVAEIAGSEDAVEIDGESGCSVAEITRSEDAVEFDGGDSSKSGQSLLQIA